MIILTKNIKKITPFKIIPYIPFRFKIVPGKSHGMFSSPEAFPIARMSRGLRLRIDHFAGLSVPVHQAGLTRCYCR